jgi:hypothetical protein
MGVTRSNRGAPNHRWGLPVGLDTKLRVGAKRWHWGITATQAVEWDDPDYPARMVEIGRFAEIKIWPVGGNRERVIPVPQEWWNDFPADGTHAKINSGNKAARRRQQAHVVFDRDHPSQRIYICMPPKLMRQFAPAYQPDNSMLLADLAKTVGGRQAKRRDYPAVRVSPLGVLLHMIYFTSKGGDENADNVRSLYDHEMGEDGGTPPVIAVDHTGRLWLAGGTYYCPIPGITK